jgi:hypothetical protein
MPTRSRSAPPENKPSIGLEDVLPHLQTTLFITGAFIVAWSWDLVVYAISHVWFGEHPLDNQLAFGNQHAPKYLWVLLLQYLGVCGGAAVLSDRYRRRGNDAAVMAIEFFPSPVFAGKLMAYLVQFQLKPLHQALLNLAATWFAAFLAHLASSSSSSNTSTTTTTTTEPPHPENTIGFWQRTGLIVRDTLGFGLGIAWNVFLAEFGPDDYSQLNTMHFLALVAYLLLVLVMALKLAAMVPDNPMTLWERHLSLLAFAMYVVCGFTLVGFLNTLLGDGWVGSLQSFGIVLVVAVLAATMVAVADLDGILANGEDQGGGYDEESNSWQYKSSKFGPFGGILNCLIFVPCVWCCCPWIPLLILLAGMTESVGVKDHWFRLIAMVAGLASSIEGSSMLTSATDALAAMLGICGTKHCYDPWMFVLLQVGVAIGCTILLLPLIAPFSPSSSTPHEIPDLQSYFPNEPPLSNYAEAMIIPTLIPSPSAPTEDQPLLYSVPPPPMAPPPTHNPSYDPNRM